MHVRAKTALLIFTLFAIANSSQAQDNKDVLKDVLAAWQKRQDAARTAQWVVVGERVVPKGALSRRAALKREIDVKPNLGEFPKEDHKSAMDMRFLIDFEKPLLRNEKYLTLPNLSKGEFGSSLMINVFNYKGIFVHEHWQPDRGKGAKPATREDLLKITPRHVIQADHYTELVFNSSVQPVLYAHGIISHGTDRPKQTQFRPKLPDPSVLVIRGKETINGRQCDVLRAKFSDDNDSNHQEYCIDRQRNGAIVRATVIWDGKVRTQYDIVYADGPDGWMPQRWTHSYYGQDNKPMVSEHLRVQELKLNTKLEPSQFQLNYRAGMFVIDAKTNKRYVVAEDGKTLIPFTRRSDES